MTYTIAAAAAVVSYLYFASGRRRVGGEEQLAYSPHHGVYVKPSVVRRIPANHVTPEDVIVDQLDRVIQPGHTAKVKN